MTQDNYGLIEISGNDKTTFLQGQLTCDVTNITSQHLQLGLHCTPQGRIISLFQMTMHDHCFYLLLPHAMQNVALTALKKYAIFYKVSLHDASNKLCELKNAIPSITELRHKMFENDIPWLYPQTSGKFLPHDLNLHLKDAISFTKGCFTGQEIIARMHYKAKLKTLLLKMIAITPHTPKPNEPIFINEGGKIRECGTIVDIESTQHEHTLLVLLSNTSDAKSQLFIQSPSQHDIILFQRQR